MKPEWLILGLVALSGTLVLMQRAPQPEATASVSPRFGDFRLSSPFILAYNGTCDSSCLTCSGQAKNNCLSCNSTSTFPYLTVDGSCTKRCPSYYMTVSGQGKVCTASCPGNTWNNTNKECVVCDSTCQTCSGSGKSACKACDVNGTFPYITYDHKCLEDCLPNTFKWTSEKGVKECRLTCMGGLYNNGTDRSCHLCHPKCAECNNGGENDCKGCYKTGTNPFLYRGQCLAACPANTFKYDNPVTGNKECRDTCGEGYYYDANNTYCVACLKECKTCANSNSCLSCKPTTPYFSQGQCLASCPAGSFTYSDKSGSKECRATCGDGYVFKTETNFCYACDETCLTCSDQGPGKCLSCNKAGPYPIFVNGNCTKGCPAQTFSYDSHAGYKECRQSCGDGFMVLSGTNQCIDCDQSCATCASSPANCLSCAQTATALYLYNGLCDSSCPLSTYKIEINGFKTCIKTCDAGNWIESSSQSCLPCHSTCATCNGGSDTQCLTCPFDRQYYYQGQCLPDCPGGLYKSGTACVASCPSGQGVTPDGSCAPCDSGCLDCNLASVCIDCLPDGPVPYLQDSLCVMECDPSRFKFKNNRGYLECITTCGDGFYVDGTNTCLPCDASCRTCDLSGCLSCGRSLEFLYKGRCLAGCDTPTYQFSDASGKSCVETCEGAFFVDTDTNYCSPCHASCLTCQSAAASGCVTCDQAGATPFFSHGECVSDCSSGTYKFSNSAGTKECVGTCGTGFLLDTAANECFSCHLTCLECFSLESTGCKTCDQRGSNSFYREHECLFECPSGEFAYDNPAGFKECIKSCEDGFTVLTGTNHCVNCDRSCETCSEPTNCTSCDSDGSTPYAYGAKCLAICPSGLYHRTTPDGKDCVNTCGNGYYLDSAASTCMACHNTCLKCTGQTKYECTVCDQNGSFPYILDGECFSDCPPGASYAEKKGVKTCMRGCEAGYAFNSEKNTCAKCHSSCKTCSDATDTSCITCNETTAFWAAGRCLTSCPSNSVRYTDGKGWLECLTECTAGNYIDAAGYCRKCNSTCQECSVNGCSLCNPLGQTPFFSQNKCLPACPENLFGFTDNDGFKTCKSMCGYGFRLDPVTKYCLPCGSGCYTCASDNLSKCLSCDYSGQTPFLVNGKCMAYCPVGLYQFDNEEIQEKQCVKACPGGFFLDEATNTCQECYETCLSCMGSRATECTACNSISDERYFFSGECLSECPPGFYQYNNATAHRYECRNKCDGNMVFNNSTHTCENCHETCSTCRNTEDSGCLSCDPSGSYPYENGGHCLAECSESEYRLTRKDGSKICVDECSAGFAVVPGTRDCQPCHESCGGCSEPIAEDKCTTCTPGSLTPYHLDGTCLVECPATHYVYEFGVNLLCFAQCPAEMYVSESNTTAKTCSSSCKGSKYADDDSMSCRSCHSSCGTCSGPDANACLFCTEAEPYHGPNDTCVSICPFWHYRLDDADGKRCVTACPVGWFWNYDSEVQPKCIPDCNDGYKVGRRCVSKEESYEWVWWLLVVIVTLILAVAKYFWSKRSVDNPEMSEPLMQRD